MALKKERGLKWDDIARIGGLESKQHAFNKFKAASIKSAEFFALVFGVDAKELIK